MRDVEIRCQKRAEMWREISQLQRLEGRGRDIDETWKVWVAALHEQDILNCRDGMVCRG